MRRYLAPLLVALLALGLVAPAAVASSNNGHDDDDKGKGKGRATELTLYAAEESFTFITREGEVLGEDDEETAPNVGDRFISVDALYLDEARTESAGHNHIECTVTRVEGEFPEVEPTEGEDLPFFSLSLTCSGVVHLIDQGTLTWMGLVTFSSDDVVDGEEPFVTVAITGGTGDFIGAAGEVSIFDESTDEDETLSRYEVTLLKGKRR